MKYKVEYHEGFPGTRTAELVEADSATDAEAKLKHENPFSYVTSVEEVYGQVIYAVETLRDGVPIKRSYGFKDEAEARQIADAAQAASVQPWTVIVIERTQTGPGTYTEREIAS